MNFYVFPKEMLHLPSHASEKKNNNNKKKIKKPITLSIEIDFNLLF